MSIDILFTSICPRLEQRQRRVSVAFSDSFYRELDVTRSGFEDAYRGAMPSCQKRRWH